MGDRIVRVEALIEQLLEKVSNNSDSCGGSTTAQENGKSSRGILSPVFGRPVLAEPRSSYEPLNVRARHSEDVLGCLLTYFVSMTRLLNTKS